MDIRNSVFVLSVFFCAVHAFTPRTNSSNLCSRAASLSCSHLLKVPVPTHPSTCLLNVSSNAHQGDCKPLGYSNPRVEYCLKEDSCGAQLEVYRHMPPKLSLYRTALNLSLWDVSNQDIKVRYQDLMSDEFSFCLDLTFHLNTHPLLLNSPLWYDCVFHPRQYEGLPFMLEYLSGNKYSKFLFYIPSEKSLEEGFVYIHHHRLPQLVISFQHVPSISNSSRYLVEVCRWIGENCLVQALQPVDLQNKSSYTLWSGNLVTVSFLNSLSVGNYTVAVKHQNCESHRCYNTQSPVFVIIGPEWNLFYPILGFAALVVSTVLIIWWRRIVANHQMMEHAGLDRTILLIYDPAVSDVQWVEAVRVFLSQWSGLQVLLDFIDIPQSGVGQDPFAWYSAAIDVVDIVAIVAGCPYDPSLHVDRDSIYHLTFDLAMELIAARVGRRLQNKEQDVLQHFVVLDEGPVIHPLPAICSSFSRFRLPDQVDELLCFVYGRPRGRRALHGESIKMIYEKIRLRDHSVSRATPTQDAEHVAETRSLLLQDDDSDEIYRSERRQQLDRDFGNMVASVSSVCRA